MLSLFLLSRIEKINKLSLLLHLNLNSLNLLLTSSVGLLFNLLPKDWGGKFCFVYILMISLLEFKHKKYLGWFFNIDKIIKELFKFKSSSFNFSSSNWFIEKP